MYFMCKKELFFMKSAKKIGFQKNLWIYSIFVAKNYINDLSNELNFSR